MIWACKGFDIEQDETSAGRGCLVGHVKTTEAKQNDNTNTVGSGLAMSVAQADAVLAKYGYVDADAVAA